MVADLLEDCHQRESRPIKQYVFKTHCTICLCNHDLQASRQNKCLAACSVSWSLRTGNACMSAHSRNPVIVWWHLWKSFHNNRTTDRTYFYNSPVLKWLKNLFFKCKKTIFSKIKTFKAIIFTEICNQVLLCSITTTSHGHVGHTPLDLILCCGISWS